jgi:hypothetical protein
VRDFRLTPATILELERRPGVGIGAFSRRAFAGDFRHADLIENIRLAMVAGGEKPERAGELTELYATSMPRSEAHSLATRILEHPWFGPEERHFHRA